VTLRGQTFQWDEIASLRISTSAEPSAAIIQRLEAEDRNSSVAVLGGPSYEQRVVYRADDVTDELVEDAPGALVTESAEAEATQADARAVMVVHGRNGEARRAMFDFLRALGLRPLEWGALVAGTGKGAPYIGEVLDHAFSVAAAVVVLFTPDDEARLREQYRAKADPTEETELTPQARPNVLFEAGMALGVHANRTILVELGQLRSFSDIYGRHVVRLDGSDGPVRDIARRLKEAGCNVDTEGDDWADPSRFPEAEAANPGSTGAPPLTEAAADREIEYLNEDARRWLRDRDGVLRAQSSQVSGEMNSRGLMHSGAHLAALANLRQAALQEYRDDITQKRRRYREICEGAPAEANLPRFALNDEALEILERWRAPVSVAGMSDTAEVGDPTDKALEPDLREFEPRGDSCDAA
jgi:predicted nucleotide-binding protein